MTQTSTHPVDRVREASDLPEALRCLREGIHFEAREWAKLAEPGDERGQDVAGQQAAEWQAEMLDACTQAESVYQRYMEQARLAAATEMRAAGYDEFATALVTGDYSGLAF